MVELFEEVGGRPYDDGIYQADLQKPEVGGRIDLERKLQLTPTARTPDVIPVPIRVRRNACRCGVAYTKHNVAVKRTREEIKGQGARCRSRFG